MGAVPNPVGISLEYLNMCREYPGDSNFGDSNAHSTFHGIPMVGEFL